MPEKLHSIIEYLLSYEPSWCKKIGIYNPYKDPWPIKISKNMPDFDSQAFSKYRNEVRLYPHPRSKKSIANRAKFWGNSVGLEFAESFMIVREIK